MTPKESNPALAAHAAAILAAKREALDDAIAHFENIPDGEVMPYPHDTKRSVIYELEKIKKEI